MMRELSPVEEQFVSQLADALENRINAKLRKGRNQTHYYLGKIQGLTAAARIVGLNGDELRRLAIERVIER